MQKWLGPLSVEWIIRKGIWSHRNVILHQAPIRIKADRPLTSDTLNAPVITDKQTIPMDCVVMVFRDYHWLNSASRVLILTCSAALVQMGEQFFTVWPWPTTLTYSPRLAKIKVDSHAKNRGQRSNGSNTRAPTDKWMDTHTQPHADATKRIISPATQSIIKGESTSRGWCMCLLACLCVACGMVGHSEVLAESQPGLQWVTESIERHASCTESS